MMRANAITICAALRPNIRLAKCNNLVIEYVETIHGNGTPKGSHGADKIYCGCSNRGINYVARRRSSRTKFHQISYERRCGVWDGVAPEDEPDSRRYPASTCCVIVLRDVPELDPDGKSVVVDGVAVTLGELRALSNIVKACNKAVRSVEEGA